MKPVISHFTMLAAVAFLSICSFTASMSAKSRTISYNTNFFDGINVSDNFDVNVLSGYYKVEVTIDEAFAPYVKVFVKGSTLNIVINQKAMPPKVRKEHKFGTEDCPRGVVTVYTRGLERVGLEGSVSMTCQDDLLPVKGDITIKTAGASDLVMPCQADKVKVSATGACNVTLSGKANQIKGSASGASHIRAADLKVSEARVVLSGASTMDVSSQDRLRMVLSGSSNVNYTGNPEVKIQKSGASTARRLSSRNN